ncbi:hypothetical protein [Streptomyces klenkii]
MSTNEFRASDRFCTSLPLRKVAELLDLDASKAPALARAGRFPCRVKKARGRYVVPVTDVMDAMGIEDPVVRVADLLAGAEFAQRWD